MTHQILTNMVASITDLKKHPMQTFKSAQGEPLAILSHNEPVFYCVPTELYETMIEALGDINLSKMVQSRAQEEEIEIDINGNYSAES